MTDSEEITTPKDLNIPAQKTPELLNPPRSRKRTYIFFGILAVLVITWIVIRPGVFTVHPMGGLPEGVTLIYRGRGAQMPFFASPDGMCLQVQGEVSLLCRMAAVTAAAELTDRILLELPYSHWAYLRSTGGREFNQ